MPTRGKCRLKFLFALRRQQVVAFEADAPYGFLDMAVSNASYLALTAPQSPANVFQTSYARSGNVYAIDLGRIDSNGKLRQGALAIVEAGDFPTRLGGKVPQYISSGAEDGEFLLSNAKDRNKGLVALRFAVDERGKLKGDATGTSVALTPRAIDAGWVNRKFQQNIQRAAGNVLVRYQDKEYALVADYNFIFNDSHWMQDTLLGKQIGGKIGVIEDPFGRNGQPRYLGATTPIVGAAIEHLTLAADGKLYADAFIDEEFVTKDDAGQERSINRMYKALFVWNTANLIQAAIDAQVRIQQDSQSASTPIDRKRGASEQIPEAAPARYDRLTTSPDAPSLGWTYGIGAYTVPGRDIALVRATNTDLIATRGPFAPPQPAVDDNATTRFLGITDADVEANIAAGNTGARSAAWYAGKVLFYTGWNFVYGGFVESQAKRTDAYYEGKLSFTQYATATDASIAYSVVGLVTGLRVGNVVTGALGRGFWGEVAGASADAVTYTFFEKGGELVTYAATEGKAGKSAAQIQGEFGQMTTDVLLNSGIVALPLLLGKSPMINNKVVWNSPTLSNPLPIRLVEPVIATDLRGLRWTLADSTGGDIVNAAGGTIKRGDTVVSLPEKGTLTLDDAHAWMEEAGSRIPLFLDKKASLRQQAYQAVQLSNAIVLAARNGMQNAQGAAQLNFTKQLLDYAGMRERLGQELGGKALYQKIIDEALEHTKKPKGACFVAGTLVHTKEGLVPIEKIKVGDYVLSKHESGEGEQSYQRVTRTFVHEAQKVRCVDVDGYTEAEHMQAQASGSLLDEAASFPLVVTVDHPFWVRGKGWVEAGRLRRLVDELILVDGTYHQVYDVSDIVRTRNPKKGWLIHGLFCPIAFTSETSRWVDFEGGGVSTSYRYEDRIENEGVDWWDENDSDLLRCTVYNIEVENTHTYYVGKKGVWVHNKPYPIGDDLNRAIEEARNDVIPPDGTRAYYTEGEARKTQVSKDQGVILVGQKNNQEPWTANQREVEGSILVQGKELQPDGSYALVDRLLEFAYRYINPFGGRDFIKSGDGRAKIYELGGKVLDVPIYSRTTIDAKLGEIFGKLLERPSLQGNFVETIKKTTAALQQNPGFSHVIEVKDPQGLVNLVQFLKQAVPDPKWGAAHKSGTAPGWKDADWFSENIYLSLAGPATLRPDGSFKRVLADDLIGFKKRYDAQGNVVGLDVIGQIKEIRDGQGKLVDLQIIGGVQKKDVLKPAEDLEPERYFRDIVNLARQANDKYLEVSGEGNSLGVAPLAQSVVDALLPAAKEYWRQAGAPSSSLEKVRVNISTLPRGVAAYTRHDDIVLSSDGAGWGWFVDATPTSHEEFVSTGVLANDFRAIRGGPADGKLDLLTVLIHEIGHALDAEHSQDPHGALAPMLEVGARRMLSESDLAAWHAASIAQCADVEHTTLYGVRSSPSRDDAAHRPEALHVVNPTLLSGTFDDLSAWDTIGSVHIVGSGADLLESASTQTRLSQRFLLGAEQRFLSFTVSGLQLPDATGPDDAFEVSLTDATTRSALSVIGRPELRGSDAFLNLQAGVELKSDRLRRTDNSDGSRTYTLDLQGLATGQAVVLSFDLIGFGALDSSVTIRDVRLVSGPQARDDAAITPEDTPLVLDALANDIAADLPGFSPAVVSGPAHGTVRLTDEGRFAYTPAADFFGQDSFTYALVSSAGGEATPSTAVVRVSVTPVNDVPVALDAVLSTTEDTPLDIGIGSIASDVDSTALQARIVAGPAHGTLVLTDGGLRYAPAPDYFGPDTFTYRVSDGEIESNLASVSLTVLPVNDAPIAVDDTLETLEDTPLAIDVLANDSDIDGDALRAVLLDQPHFGTLTQTGAGTFTYTPNADFFGPDRFTYRASDGTLVSDIATVTITVRPVNDAPIAADDAAITDEDVPVMVDVLANDRDVDLDPLTAVIVDGPRYGTLVPTGAGTFAYTPGVNFFGTDRFTYRADDGALQSGLATATITVRPVNDAPTARDDAVSTPEDTPLALDLVANASDVDGDALNAVLIDQPRFGTLTQTGAGTFAYTPNADFFGTDRFTYRASDGLLQSGLATVTLTVTPVNDAPIAGDDVVTTLQGTSVSIDLLANATDPDGDALTASIVGGPRSGTLSSFGPGRYTYAPAAGFYGEDVFTYRVSDGALASNVATVTLTVVRTSVPPVAAADAFGLDEDTAATLDVLANDTVADRTRIAVTVLDAPRSGMLVQSAPGVFAYTPAANFFGSDGFTYRLADGALESGIAQVVLTIAPVNDAPVARDDAFSTLEDTAVRIDPFANDSDADGDALIAAVVDGPMYGRLVAQSDGSVLYVPDANFSGTDSFYYRLSDGRLESDVAMVRLTVRSVNDPPSGTDNTLNVIAGKPYAFATGDFGFTDPADRGANALLSVTINTLPASGWWDAAWQRRQQLAFNNASRAENLVDFPVLVAIDTARFGEGFYAQAKSGGADLRFVDADGRTLAHEIQTWNPRGISYVWVKVPQVDAASDADAIWMYWGNANAADAQDRAGVWSNGYVGVWHLDQNPSGAILDSTRYANNGRAFGLEAEDLQAGRIGNALYFNNSGGSAKDYIRIGATAGDELSPATTLTIEAWAKRQGSTGAWMNIVGRQRGTSWEDAYALDSTAGAPDRLTFFADGTSAQGAASGAGALPDNTWTYVAGVRDAAAMRVFSNGALVGSRTPGGGMLIDTNDVLIGAQENGPGATPSEGWRGWLDEIRISNVARSGAWVSAQYASMSGSFIRYGTPTERGSAGGLTLAGAAVTAGQRVSAADIAAGRLQYSAPVWASGPRYASFTFQVQDDGGTANGGIDIDPTPNTMTFNVAARSNVTPIAYWRFDEKSGRVVGDSAGTPQNGIFYGCNPDRDDAGPPLALATYGAGTGADVHGNTSEYVAIAHDRAFEVEEGTIALWFKTRDAGRTQTLLSKDGAGPGDGGHLNVSNEGQHVRVRMQSETASYVIVSKGDRVLSNAWHHVALTFGPGGMRLYLDGVLVGQDDYTGGLSRNREPLVLGGSIMTNTSTADLSRLAITQPFDGYLDEVVFYGTALAQTQIARLRTDGPNALGGDNTLTATASSSASIVVTSTVPSIKSEPASAPSSAVPQESEDEARRRERARSVHIDWSAERIPGALPARAQWLGTFLTQGGVDPGVNRFVVRVPS